MSAFDPKRTCRAGSKSFRQGACVGCTGQRSTASRSVTTLAEGLRPGRDNDRVRMVGTAGRYTGSYLGQCSGWRTVAILADIGKTSLVGRIPEGNYALPARRQ